MHLKQFICKLRESISSGRTIQTVQLSNRSIHHGKQTPLPSLQSWSCRIVAHSWRQVSDTHIETHSPTYSGEIVSKILGEKSGNSWDLISWRLCQITTLLVPDYIFPSIALLFYNTGKICITKVVCAGISTGNNRVENFMGNLSRETFGMGASIPGLQTRV